jgi:hypothetical protein
MMSPGAVVLIVLGCALVAMRRRVIGYAVLVVAMFV